MKEASNFTLCRHSGVKNELEDIRALIGGLALRAALSAEANNEWCLMSLVDLYKSEDFSSKQEKANRLLVAADEED